MNHEDINFLTQNNPQADDIDFRIEADFAGLMSPGMIKASFDMRQHNIMDYGFATFTNA
jgi:hypothetical protein